MSAQGRAKPRSAALDYAMSRFLRRTGRHENQMVGGASQLWPAPRLANVSPFQGEARIVARLPRAALVSGFLIPTLYGCGDGIALDEDDSPPIGLKASKFKPC